MADIHETVFESVSTDNMATFFSSEYVWEQRALKLAEQYPDDVKLVAHNVDGSVTIHLPKKWFKISPPRKINLTDEQKAAIGLRLKQARDNKSNT